MNSALQVNAPVFLEGEFDLMYPQAFLRTFWRMELRPTVFVAMPFGGDFDRRFRDVIDPAVRELKLAGISLESLRVDLSSSGDSILTDILDGICHSQLFLADVSSVGRDSKTGGSYRNGNVMYEVGLALACRDPAEVLLVRDDADRFLFDVSTIPHLRVDFTDTAVARERLLEALGDRLRQQAYERDARVEKALRSLSTEETRELMLILANASTGPWGVQHRKYPGLHEAAITRLLDKQVVRVVGKFTNGRPSFELTPLGRIVADRFNASLPITEDTIGKTFD